MARPTVAVITSTIGRPELRHCVASVKAQTYQARHFVFVNGRGRWDATYAAIGIEINYPAPDCEVIVLPEETGDYGMGGSMADVFAAAPFLTRADWIFYLDDDNWYDPNHIESVMRLVKEHDLSWAYSLRRYVDKSGSPICDDDWCSLGHHPVYGTTSHLVDNSCYAVSRKLAQRYSLAWTAMPLVADRCFFMALRESGARSGCTGLSTVNYRIGTGTAHKGPEHYLELANKMRKEMPGGFPWRREQVFSSSSPGHSA